MKSIHNLLHWRLLLVVVLVFGGALTGGAPVFAADATGSASSTATPSNATPNVGGTITVNVNVNMTSVNSPDHKLGAFTGTLTWNTAVLSYSSSGSALQGIFAGGVLNDVNATAGNITFSSAAAAGATGNVTILTVAFNVVGAGTSPLTLGYTDMAAATTFADLVPILTINHGSVTASTAPTCYALTLAHTGTGSNPVASPANSTGCSAGQYVVGQVIGLTATPSSGWSVGSWTNTSNDSSTATTNQWTMTAAARTVTVNYVQCYALTLAHTGTGSDPVASPANSTGCSAGQYVAGAVIGLTATPSSGWSVGSWSGTDNNSSTATTNQVTMPASARTASVTYVQIPPTCYALTLAHTGTGSNPVASPANSTGCSAGQYVVGQVIGLTATPGSGWSVGSWTNTSNDSSTATTNQWTMTAAAHRYRQLCAVLCADVGAYGHRQRPGGQPGQLHRLLRRYVRGRPGHRPDGLAQLGLERGQLDQHEQRQQHGHHQPV